MSKRICTIPECGNVASVRDYCRKHYESMKSAGTLPAIIRPTALERFWGKVDKRGQDDCWNWTGHIAVDTGYGQLRRHDLHTAVNTHRYIFEIENGPIPDGMLVDHMCHNRSCVNVRHLRLVTRKQNAENMAGATRASKSGIRGVWFMPKTGRWTGQVNHNGVTHCLKTYATAVEAERAAIALRNNLFTHNDADRGLVITPAA